MQSDEYALWAIAFLFEGMNQGVSGFNIWCLHEMYYPGGQKMNYGLWNFDETWSQRPVFFAWSMLTQNTKAGDSIYPCTTNHPDLKAIRINDTLFFANLGDTDLTLSIAEPDINAIERFSPGVGEAATRAISDNEKINIPAKSFGRLYKKS